MALLNNPRGISSRHSSTNSLSKVSPVSETQTRLKKADPVAKRHSIQRDFIDENIRSLTPDIPSHSTTSRHPTRLSKDASSNSLTPKDFFTLFLRDTRRSAIEAAKTKSVPPFGFETLLRAPRRALQGNAMLHPRLDVLQRRNDPFQNTSPIPPSLQPPPPVPSEDILSSKTIIDLQHASTVPIYKDKRQSSTSLISGSVLANTASNLHMSPFWALDSCGLERMRLTEFRETEFRETEFREQQQPGAHQQQFEQQLQQQLLKLQQLQHLKQLQQMQLRDNNHHSNLFPSWKQGTKFCANDQKGILNKKGL